MSDDGGEQPGPLGKVAVFLSHTFSGISGCDTSLERGGAAVADDAGKYEGLTHLLLDDSYSELLAIVLQALPERCQHMILPTNYRSC